MANIHLILQGKGGVGKSFIATLLAQYMAHKGQLPLCIDTDPVNATFQGYRALNVHTLNIIEQEEINTRSFDSLIELIAKSSKNVVIDNGASSFIALLHYLTSNQIPELLASMGHQLIVHTVITGGQAFLDTVNGFAKLIGKFATFIVWLNPYWGVIEHEGKNFEQLKIYKEHKDQVAAIIHMPMLKRETYGHDLSEMLQDRLTFDEALAKSTLTIMTRQRLKIIRDQLFTQIDNTRIF